MDPIFARMLDETVPPVNPIVTQGLGGFFMQHAEAYLDGIFRDLSRGFPPELTYDGFKAMSPEEMMIENSRDRAGVKRTVDITPASMYMVRVRFNWMGQPLVELPLWLLYTDRHGIFHITGKKRHIVPVLNHRVLAPSATTVFLRVSKAKITFRKIFHSIMIDGVATAVDLPYGNIYQSKGKASAEKNLIQCKAETLITHYLLAKYGFEEAFKRFVGCVPIVGTSADITPEAYPPADYVHVGYCGLRPSTALITSGYRGTDIRMAIPRDQWTPAMRVMVAGTYYVIDHFPDEINVADFRNAYRWVIFLGYILQSMTYVHGKLEREMTAHLDNLDEHLDFVHREKLAYSGVHVSDFYSLLAYVNNNFEALIRTGVDGGNSVYDKIIEVLHDTYEPVIHSFNALGFAVTKLVAKQPAAQIEPKNLIATIRDEFKAGRIYRSINRSGGKSESLASDTVDCCNPIQYLKVAAKANQQEAVAVQTSAGSKRQVGPNSRHDPSHVDLGSILFLPKTKTTPIARLNPYAHVGTDGSITPNPHIQNIVNALREYYHCGDTTLLDPETAEMMSVGELE